LKEGDGLVLSAETTKQDLFKACESLFGTDIDVSVEFLRYLQPSGVKAAYRKKALETHPDRAIMLADHTGSLENRFKEVNLAYQMLNEFITYPGKYHLDEDGLISKRANWPKRSETGRNYDGTEEQKYRGGLPKRKVLLGQYLYYSGYTSLTTLIKAIVWQRLQRPAIGSLAVRWDWLKPDKIIEVLQERHYGEKFGECALRCGHISKYQLVMLLDRQRMLQPQIGKYFVDEGIVSLSELDDLISDMKKHNREYWSS
jgi:hypothetical protein